MRLRDGKREDGSLDAKLRMSKETWRGLQGPATITKPTKTASLGGEAIEQPVAARASQIALATTAVGPARGM